MRTWKPRWDLHMVQFVKNLEVYKIYIGRSFVSIRSKIGAILSHYLFLEAFGAHFPMIVGPPADTFQYKTCGFTLFQFIELDFLF